MAGHRAGLAAVPHTVERAPDSGISCLTLSAFSSETGGAHRRPDPRLATLVKYMPQTDHLRRIRFWLAAFVAGLVLSGVTAFPLQSELRWLVSRLHADSLQSMAESTGLLPWIKRVYVALSTTNAHYPFLAYGTDWLAFAHLVIAAAFIGPYGDPVRNKWVITFGLIACAAVIPLALIAGSMRGIPLPWRLIDCSFGILGSVPLLICKRSILALECRGG
jgi:hypothetical protein